MLEVFKHVFDASALSPAAELQLRIGSFDGREPNSDEQAAIMLQVLKHLDSGLKSVSVDDGFSIETYRRGLWERCYHDLREAFEKDFTRQSLLPSFLRKPMGEPVRLNGKYFVPKNGNFEIDFLSVVRAELFDRYFASCTEVHEFGAGTGHNLVALAGQQPGKKLYGWEWSSEAVKLMLSAAKLLSLNLYSGTFDMFHPSGLPDRLSEDAGVMTIGAMEQLGTRFKPFLDFLLRVKPRVCVHLEPGLEFYDPNKLFDYLAISYHKKRGYLEGFIPALNKLQMLNRVQVLAQRRLKFGSLYHEAYTVIVWKPL